LDSALADRVLVRFCTTIGSRGKVELTSHFCCRFSHVNMRNSVPTKKIVQWANVCFVAH